jgi:peptide/nickel transport system substrate-binding protein
VSAVQSGQVALAAALPMRTASRIGQTANFASSLTPTVDTYLIHMVNTGPLTDKNVRLAMHHAIDKAALSKAFFNNIAAPLSTPSPPGTPAYAPDYRFEFSAARAQELLKQSGYGPDKPVQFKFFATSGIYPNDFEMARAIVQMWKKVGIDATLEVIELAQYQSKAGAGKLEGPALWFWTNATGDPELSAGYYLNPKKSFSIWRSADVSEKLDPLLVELDYDKRIQGYKDFHVWAVEQGYTLPLVQGVSTVAYSKSSSGYKAFRNGWILPYYWS